MQGYDLVEQLPNRSQIRFVRPNEAGDYWSSVVQLYVFKAGT
jgi:hypothetical protein